MNNNFRNFLPSRKIVAFVLVPIFAFFIFLILNSYLKKDKKENVLAKKRLEESITENITEKDIDNDGLLDWQERLYGTDVEKTDTDGDGVSDGDEVQKGTDPLDIFNKSEKEDIKKIQEDTQKEDLNKDLTVTEKIAREMFKKTVELKKDNLSNNSSALELVSDEIYENTGIYDVSKSLSKKDLKISDEMDMYTFKIKFNKILNSKKNIKLESEWASGYKYIVEEKIEGKESLEKNMHFYISTQQELLSLEVPNDKNFIDIYLEYLNSYFLMIEYIEQILNFEKDPIKALAFFQSFDTISSIVIKRGKSVYKYLNDSGNII